MKKLIIIKYAELSTKKDNINFFIKILKQNILNKLNKYNLKIVFDRSRMYIIPDENDFLNVTNDLKKIFGIHKIIIGYEINSIDINVISDNIIELLKEKTFNNFKINTKRLNKEYYLKSPEINNLLGGNVLKNISGIKVNVIDPDLEVTVEIRNTSTYIYFDLINGLKGLPVGTSGKGLLMLSGGIDSPVAGYLALKRGIKLDAIYFESPPHTSINAKNKVIELAKILSGYGNNIRIHVINLTEIQESIYKNIPEEYLITILRRMMYRISSIIAYKIKAKIIINGENIGQVASQTLDSISVIDKVASLPIIRPVVCFDKLEIIEIAKEIETYNTSILPYEDCCTIFIPKHPAINPNIKKCEEYEKLIDYEKMIDTAVKNREVIISNQEKFNDVL